MNVRSLSCANVSHFIDDLNDEQRMAVLAEPNGHILLIAGAGCGKTTVLTYRLAYLLTLGMPSHSLLALTFTRKAAEEMKHRLERLAVEWRVQDFPLVTTFHGFALRLLTEYCGGRSNAMRLGYPSPQPRLLSYEERLGLLAAVSTKDERRSFGDDLLKLDAWLEQRSVHPDRLCRLSKEQRLILDQIAQRISEEKKRLGAWDFADMINGALELMSTFPDTADHVASRYRTILVDEFQDTNPAQIALLCVLLSRGATLFAVGDDDQAIYGFRGADTGPTLRFAELFPGARILKLQTNYRSTPAILAAANRIFRNKEAVYRKVLKSGRYTLTEYGLKPRIMRCRNLDAMVCRIHCELASLELRCHVDRAEAALLFRLNRSMDETRQRYKEMFPRSPSPCFLTIHSAKGLEFPTVFICDLEDGIFPCYRIERPRNIFEHLVRYLGVRPAVPNDCDIDEERRLFYGGVTRAQRFLYLVTVRSKMHFNRTLRLLPSRFIRLIR